MIATVICFILSLIAFFSCWRVSGFHFRILSFELPQNMKSGGDKPGEQGTCRQILLYDWTRCGNSTNIQQLNKVINEKMKRVNVTMGNQAIENVQDVRLLLAI